MTSRRGNGEGSIFRATDRSGYVGQLDLGTDEFGRRVRRKVRGRTKSEVADKLKALRDQHDGRPTPLRHLRTVEELAAAWLDTAARGRLAEGSTMLETYEAIIRLHLVPSLGSIRLDRLSAEDVDRWLLAKARAGYARSTVTRLRSTLSQILRWGVRRRHCSWDPASFAELPPRSVHDAATPKQRRTTRSLTVDEAQRFLKAALDHRDGAAMIVGLTVGLRPGEILALAWDDIDLKAGTVSVQQAWKGHGEHRHLGPPKTTSSVRTVALAEVAVEALRRHRTAQLTARLQSSNRTDEWKQLVFTSGAGTPIHPANFRRSVQEVADAAGVGHFTPYELRHTATSLLADAGVSTFAIADLMGHTSTRMVEQHYRHRLSDVVDVAAGPMEQLLSRSAGPGPAPTDRAAERGGVPADSGPPSLAEVEAI